MVKINISIEGDDMEEIMTELISFGIQSIKSNKENMKELIDFFADELFNVLEEKGVI